jgi:glucose-1-phosphate thymidylyltransferase
MEIVGLIPGAGQANRLGNIPCSKEVFPVMNSTGELTVLSSNLIRYFRLAAITKLYFIIRKGKWDIPSYFGDGSELGVRIAYLMMNLPFGTPFTLNQAYPYIKNKIIALGFPDILFKPDNAFSLLKERFLASRADVILGIVPTDKYQNSDMIDFDDNGNIREIVIKKNRPDLKYSWFISLWRPSFSSFVNDFLEQLLKIDKEGRITLNDGSRREVYVGDVIQAAIANRMIVDYEIFENGSYKDMGTPEDLAGYKNDV